MRPLRVQHFPLREGEIFNRDSSLLRIKDRRSPSLQLQPGVVKQAVQWQIGLHLAPSTSGRRINEWDAPQNSPSRLSLPATAPAFTGARKHGGQLRTTNTASQHLLRSVEEEKKKKASLLGDQVCRSHSQPPQVKPQTNTITVIRLIRASVLRAEAARRS